MTVAEYIVKRIEGTGVKHVFMVNGGGAMYLNDAFSRSEKITPIYCHHEQACAMAAVGYSKYRNGLAVVVTSTGCGSTNAITGLLDAWQDGCPVLFISGNVNVADTEKVGIGKKRKHGVQGANIIELVTPITKRAISIDKPITILRELDSIILTCRNELAPCWIDVPLDIQRSEVDTLNNFDDIFEAIRNAERPIVVAGNGLAQFREEFKEFIEVTEIPFTCTYLTIDLLPSDNFWNIGRLGTKGDRAGNYAVRRADVIIVLGSSLTVPVVGYGDDFGNGAKVLNINTDEGLNLSYFFRRITSCLEDYKAPKEWQYQCNVWKQQWPVFKEEYRDVSKGINIYYLLEKIHEHSPDDAVIVSDAGSAYYATSQAYKIKGTQRYVTSGGQADMGFSLPAAIGAALSSGKGVIALTGDGSLQTNIQELATLSALNLPIKLIVLNNGGYLSIRNTANKFFGGHIKGTDVNNGLFFPDLAQLAEAYDLGYHLIEKEEDFKALYYFLGTDMPIIIEVICQPDQEILPCAAFGKGLDDMNY